MNDTNEEPLGLPDEWYTLIVADGIDSSKPGLYQWQIEGAGCYIGKYTHISRPRREYAANVLRLMQGRPYRLSNPHGFRRVHRALLQAHLDRRQITLTILENASPADIHKRERELISRHGSLNDPPFGRRHSGCIQVQGESHGEGDKMPDGIILLPGRWYGWTMLPGYTDEPYQSPVKITRVEPVKAGSQLLRLDLFNAGYASGVQMQQHVIRVLKRTSSALAGEIQSLEGTPTDRLVILEELSPRWLRIAMPGIEVDAADLQLAMEEATRLRAD